MARRRYSNLNNNNTVKTWRDYRRWKIETRDKKKDYSFVLSRALHIDPKFLQTNINEETITWIGHATFLIQIGGLNIVTDPVWAKTMSFKRRLVAPGISLEDLPEIDVVLISHAHYDHLHFRSIRSLKGNPIHLVPSGLKRMFLRKGITNVEEYEWWSNRELQGVEFTFVPSQHWTRRAIRDINTSHWGGWVIRYAPDNELTADEEKKDTFYFAGDSGYFEGFKEIGKKFDIDCVMMPIGAYDPEWFMSLHHVTPEQAVQAYVDCGAKIFIPMHYGTFRMADDTAKDALSRLRREWDRREFHKDRLKILKIGESFIH